MRSSTASTSRRTTSSSRAAGCRTSWSTRSRATSTSRTGCGSPATARSTISTPARCRRWGGDVPTIDFENIYYYIRPTEKQANSWEELPADIKDTWDRLGIPEAEKKYLAGVGAQYESEVVYHKLQEDLEAQGVLFLDMDSGLREHEEIVRAVLRQDHPAERQQVRGAELGRLVGRLVHLRAAGREDRAAAAGLLPHQRGEHGPVRTDADHRRRGRLRALRRGLHGADLLERLAALGGGRDHRQEGRPLPLHDDPELVDERLQPGHQAGGRLRGRDDGVGRRQPGLEADDEVPGDLADGRARARRGALDRVRRQGPAPGRGRQVRPRRAEHDLPDHVEVDLQGRRPRQLPRAARGGEGCARLEVEGRLRRADPRRGLPLGHLSVHPHRRVERRHRSRGDRVQARRGAALLPDEPRPVRVRGVAR